MKIRLKSIATAFRTFVNDSPTPELGTRETIIKRFQETYPDRPHQKVQDVIVSYINSAKRGVLEGCMSLEEGPRGLVRLEKGAAPSPSLFQKRFAAPSSLADSVDVVALLRRVQELEEQVGKLSPSPLEIRETKAKGVEVRKVKGTLPAVFGKLVKLASIRQNVLMVGPSGCGKTHIAGKVAEALKLSFSFVSCSAGMSEGQLAGRLLPVEAGGRFSYVPAPFVDAYENGGLFLFDEIDAADANTLAFLNAAIANGVLSLPQRPEKPIAVRHKNFVCFAAANTYGHGANRIYAGRNQLDGATLDRFRAGMVQIGYDEAVEKELCEGEVLSWGLPIRAVIERLGLRRIMSTRVLRDFSEQKRELGWGKDVWEESYFADWSVDDRQKLSAELRLQGRV